MYRNFPVKTDFVQIAFSVDINTVSKLVSVGRPQGLVVDGRKVSHKIKKDNSFFLNVQVEDRYA